MNTSLIEKMKTVDTPTICNAIEVAQGKRGFANFTRGTMLCSAPDAPPIVGFARTAKIAALHPPSESVDILKQRRMDYYKYMADAPKPAVAVIEDVDFPDCIGAYWGEINVTIHKGFGLSGTLTNGVMRDMGDVPSGYPVVAGSIGPSHGFVHVKEIATSVNVFGLIVEDGDLIHADRHGGVVVPSGVIDSLEHAIDKLIATEQIILKPAQAEGFGYVEFEKAWQLFEKSRT